MRDLLLVLHIIGVSAWLGANIVQALTTRRMVAQGGQTAAHWMGTTVLWGRVLYMPAGILILATGIGLVLDSAAYQFSSAFVSIGFVVVIIGAVLGVVVFGKGGERAEAAFADGDDAAGRAQVAKLMPWGIVDTVLIVVVIVAMVAKWGV